MRILDITEIIYTFLRLFMDGFRGRSIAQSYPWIGRIAAIIGAIVGCFFVIPFVIIKLSFDCISWLYIDCFLHPLKAYSLHLTIPVNQNFPLHKNHFAGHWFMLLLTPTYYLSVPVYYVLTFPIIILLISVLMFPEMLFVPIFMQQANYLTLLLLLLAEILFLFFHLCTVCSIPHYPNVTNYVATICFFGDFRSEVTKALIAIVQHVLATLFTILPCVCFYLPHKILYFFCITWRDISQSFDKKITLQRIVDQANQHIEEKKGGAIRSSNPPPPTGIQMTICKDNTLSVTNLNKAIQPIQPHRCINQLRQMVKWNEDTEMLYMALKFYRYAHTITLLDEDGTKKSLPKEIVNVLFEYITPFFEPSLFETSMLPVNDKQSFFTLYDANVALYHDNYLNFLTVTLYYGPQNAFRLFGLQIVACSLNTPKHYSNPLLRKDAIDTIEVLYQLMSKNHMMPLPSSTRSETPIPNWIVANGNGHPYTMKAAFRTRLTLSYFKETQRHYHLKENITWGWFCNPPPRHTACCSEQLEAIKQDVNPGKDPSSSLFKKSLTLFFQREFYHDTSSQLEEAMHMQRQFAKLLYKL